MSLYGTPQIIITVSPEQLETLIDNRLDNAFQKYLSASPVSGPQIPELVTIHQSCEFLQISRATLLRLSKDTPNQPAVLVPRRVGKRVLYRREDIMAVAKEYRRFRDDKRKG